MYAALSSCVEDGTVIKTGKSRLCSLSLDFSGDYGHGE